MILPNKSIQPIDSLFCISSYIIDLAKHKDFTVDCIHSELLKTYPKKISIETIIHCINYLYIIGKLEVQDEIIKIKF
ncbi:ABC-three component system middle component 6 [Marinicellulosiphila megalodicopiae]|uniref:ABC-three component system middle component 6 n=1 Tax=Marinicellulosiphila megalodicopiae TaxID=2724896 RepID=UPI003BAF0489